MIHRIDYDKWPEPDYHDQDENESILAKNDRKVDDQSEIVD